MRFYLATSIITCIQQCLGSILFSLFHFKYLNLTTNAIFILSFGFYLSQPNKTIVQCEASI